MWGTWNGYTCSLCGAWVQYGYMHACNPPVQQPQMVPVTFYAGVTEERVREIVREELSARDVRPELPDE